MALLDFIKNRIAPKQQPVANKPQEQKLETVHQKQARVDAEDRAKLTPVDSMPADQTAQLGAIRERFEKATGHHGPAIEPPPANSAGTMDNREPMRQNMSGQDQSTPALTPTSAETGKTTLENSTSRSDQSPAKTPRPQTLPRPRPSWER
jgi:hypothetical protein